MRGGLTPAIVHLHAYLCPFFGFSFFFALLRQGCAVGFRFCDISV